MSQCNQCCKTPCECMDCPHDCTNGVVPSDAWEAPPMECPVCRPVNTTDPPPYGTYSATREARSVMLARIHDRLDKPTNAASALVLLLSSAVPFVDSVGAQMWLSVAIASAASLAVAGEFAAWVASDAYRKGNSDD